MPLKKPFLPYPGVLTGKALRNFQGLQGIQQETWVTFEYNKTHFTSSPFLIARIPAGSMVVPNVYVRVIVKGRYILRIGTGQNSLGITFLPILGDVNEISFDLQFGVLRPLMLKRFEGETDIFMSFTHIPGFTLKPGSGLIAFRYLIYSEPEL